MKNSKDKNLIIVFFIIIILVVLIIWKGYYAPRQQQESIRKSLPFKQVDLNFELLKDPVLKSLEPFEQIEKLDQGFGRSNPFSF